MCEYYAEVLLNSEGTHTIHVDGCASSPEREKLTLIGVRSKSETAIKEASNWYQGKVVACPDCIGT